MKPEMTNDTERAEFAGLELRLRQLRPAQVPAAPPSLRQFIATVPATTAPRRFAFRMPASPFARRGALAVGVAFALVIALAATSFVVNFRASQTVAPVAGSEWQWQKADGTVLGQVDTLAHGYVAVCRPGGAAAPTATSSDPFDQLREQFSGPDAGSLCTSPDGLTWTTPPDPRILDVSAGSTFDPGTQAQLGDVRLIAGTTSDSIGNSITALWRSTDGVRWSEVSDPPLENLMVMSLGVIGGRFVGVAEDVATHTGWTIASSDGLSWQRLNQLQAEPGSSAIGAGLMTYNSAGNPVRVSRDGVTWQDLRLPAGIETLSVISDLSSGGYFAAGMGNGAFDQRILRSTDGLTWQRDEGTLPGHVLSFTWLGDRLIASVVEGSPDFLDASSFSNLYLWESRDEGQTWSPLIGPDGKKLAGQGARMGDVLAVRVPDAQYRSRLMWIGRLASAKPSPTGAPSLSAAPTPAPTSTPAGPTAALSTAVPTTPDTTWQWKEVTGLSPGLNITRGKNGYLGLCGDKRCSSKDAVTWSTPPDATIGDAQALAFGETVSVGGVYLATTVPPLTSTAYLMRSDDGITWVPIRPAELSAYTSFTLVSWDGRFLVVVGKNGIPSAAFTSDDGKKFAPLNGFTFPAIGGTACTLPGSLRGGGAYLVWGSGGCTPMWIMHDGTSWTQMRFADATAEAAYVSPMQRLSDGSFIGVVPVDHAFRIATSPDGVVWTIEANSPIVSANAMLGTVGDRLVTNGVLAGAVGDLPQDGLWDSSDSGKTWHPVVGPDGNQMEGWVIPLGDRVAIDHVTDSAERLWIGMPNG